jgi:hypothetical protein
MFGSIHHVGLVTNDLIRSETHFRALGYARRAEPVDDHTQGVEILFLVRDGAHASEPLIELIRPHSSDSKVYGFTTRNDYPIHHVCFATNDMAASVEVARKQRFGVVQGPVAAPAIGGSAICFFYSLGLGLFELVERPPF